MKKIIVVEDDESILDLYVEILSSEGYEVVAARNGKEALDVLNSEDRLPCLIITDFMMPEMNGGELIQMIRKEDLLMSLPVVVVSAEPKIRDKLGKSVDFMKKPIELDAIIAKVKEYCGSPFTDCPSTAQKFEKALKEPDSQP